MKKVVAILLILAMVLSFAACAPKTASSKMNIAMVTDVGNIDDKSFNEFTWMGCKNWAAENGAVALVRQVNDSPRGEVPTGLRRIYQQDEQTRTLNFSRMQQVTARILREVPGSTTAADSSGRETDIAIDHSEFSHLTKAQIGQVVAIMQAEGMSATVSSIHVNGWYGAHNKLEGARWIVRELFARSLDAERSRWAYVGDSTNDQLMFEAFDNSIGVANIRRFVPELNHLPHFVTRSERGAGFSEVAHALLQTRASDLGGA